MYAPAIQKPLTFEEFLAWDDGSGRSFELRDGCPMPYTDPNANHEDVADDLCETLADHCKASALPYTPMGVPRQRIGIKNLIAVDSAKVTAREPDLTIHSEASKRAISQEKQAFLQPDMPAPLLVIEVVSPGEPSEPNYDRDYIDKREEYAKRGIPEFWLIDPMRAVVLVLSLVGSAYKAAEFRGSDRIQSTQFNQLNLTAQPVLIAGGDK